ncbi:hypothetical protein EYF80_010111 [Liparis tanakae]|uniref:Uncharacterized protein n=1 Tax=Liparis tanakae TaxID=230148 RepID=A0A4Z2IPK9_9TELE|nr:hypothetical protein EYF80_010111 [Liparis tanakae]
MIVVGCAAPHLAVPSGNPRNVNSGGGPRPSECSYSCSYCLKRPRREGPTPRRLAGADRMHTKASLGLPRQLGLYQMLRSLSPANQQQHMISLFGWAAPPSSVMIQLAVALWQDARKYIDWMRYTGARSGTERAQRHANYSAPPRGFEGGQRKSHLK